MLASGLSGGLEMTAALAGVRVIDFGHYIAGPLAAVMLSDQGADVIHVDPPGGPRWKTPADAFFNRGKRRILDYQGRVTNEPRGYAALGTGPLQRFYQARDGWFFLAATEADAARLSGVEGLQTANLEGSQLEHALEAQFAELPA